MALSRREDWPESTGRNDWIALVRDTRAWALGRKAGSQRRGANGGESREWDEKV